MTEDEVLNHFRETGALLEGHFILTSGLHSPMYLQCAKVLMYPERAAILLRELAVRIKDKINNLPVDLIVSPAMGGVIAGYELGKQIGAPAIFLERVQGHFDLRRGFQIKSGSNVLMIEDVITTGLSSRECIQVITGYGGEVIAAGCLVDRSSGAVDIGAPIVSLVNVNSPVYREDELPGELSRIPVEMPGSRKLT